MRSQWGVDVALEEKGWDEGEVTYNARFLS